MADLSEKVAIVTGSTQGLGEAIARQLIAEHMIGGLVICGRNAGNRDDMLWPSASGGRRRCVCVCGRWGWPVASCVSRDDDDAGRRRFGACGRGRPPPALRARAMPPLAVSLRWCLAAGAPKIQGSVVNILSMSSHGGQPFLCPYSMSKGALATLTKNVALSVVREQIRVNGLNIGWMDTPGEHAIQKNFHNAESEAG